MKTHLLAGGRPPRWLAAFGLLWLALVSAQAQWLTQSITLKPGWNAVFLHVDSSHTTLDALVGADGGNPIQEVWLWQPASAAQFVESPQLPTGTGSQWASWVRPLGPSSALQRLVGNAAYLVNNTNTTDFVWLVQGKPVPPRFLWTSSGLNFVGFTTPAGAAPNFETFLAPVPEFRNVAEIFRYPGGELGATNPVRINSLQLAGTLVHRGEAFWVRAGTNGNVYNRYFMPVTVELQNGSGVHFGDMLGTYRMRLRNVTGTARTVTLSLLDSEPAPDGQPVIVQAPPVLVRGALNPTNLTYAHTFLGSPQNFTLAAQGQPGSEVEVVLGLNRSAMTTDPGSLYAGVLRFADTGGLEQIDVPVTAMVADNAGLWVGSASVSQVRSYLKSFARATNAAEIDAAVIAANDAVNPPGAVWTPRGSPQAWSAVASSADGSKLVAAVNPGGLFRSVNSGVTWSPLNQTNTWRAVASSADGARLFAVPKDKIYTSANGGIHWTRRSDSNDWAAVACSSDGSKAVAAVNGGGLYTSVDFGTNWVLRSAAGTARAWSGVASSADGSRLVAVVNGGALYTSDDSGTNWVVQTNAGTARAWSSVASSADGGKLVAGVSPGGIYTSMDFGTNWTLQPAAEIQSWRGIASSADGNRLIAVPKDRIYASPNAGNHWTRRSNSNDWSSVATSFDGRQSVAVNRGGYIWTSTQVLGSFSRDTNTGLIISSAGSYVVTGLNRDFGSVARTMPLRLILHTDSTNTHLLQRVYYGINPGSNYVNATRESLLDPKQLASARRVSAIHLPVTPTNTVWQFSGPLQAGTSLTTTVRLEHSDHASNPFLHTYHPDHDNLDAKFQQPLAPGFESYTITRVITLTITPPGNDFVSLTSSGQVFTGVYAETVTLAGKGTESRTFATQGTFSLNRINRIGTLTTQ